MERGRWPRLVHWSLLLVPAALVVVGYGACALSDPRSGPFADRRLTTAGVVRSTLLRATLERGALVLTSEQTPVPCWPRPWTTVTTTGGNFSYAGLGPIGNRRPKWQLEWMWVPRFELSAASQSATIPLWVGMLPAGLGGLLVRRGRSVARGCCGACGYDRAGIGLDAVCPECGSIA